MKTTWDIMNFLYPIINAASVTSLIDGEVYREKKPVNSELQDIVIKPLTNNDVGDVAQESTVNINIYCKKLKEGMFNETKLKEITDAVITELEAYVNASNDYFDFDIVSQKPFDDKDNEKMSFNNIRLECVIGNNT